MFSPTDTIVALATAPVRAGIGVVRISGPLAHQVARAILTVPHDLEPRHATLTHVLGTVAHLAAAAADGSAATADSWSPGSSDPGARIDEVVATFFPAPPAFARTPRTASFGETPPRVQVIDEVVATYFPAPHSYTAEDVVEISAHGSLALLREIVRAAMAHGGRLAEPGEFTLRAFLNGRLDLVQAEAVADLVDAVTPLQARVAFDQLEGTLTRAIGALDERLFDLAARLEASVDFPDEGYHFVAPGEAASELVVVRDGIDALLATSAAGRVIREGRHIAILGKPNVGKSSLFNQLVGTDRAIVAAGPGTTRDMLLETIDLDGLRLGLVDTAGIRTSEDEVEQEGVTRARKAAAIADLVVLVLDRSRPIEDIDRALLAETASSPRVIVINKVDLPAAWDAGALGAEQKQEARNKEQEGTRGEAVGSSSDGPSNQADDRQFAKRTEGAETLVGWRSGAPRAAGRTLEVRFAGLRERDRTKSSQPAAQFVLLSLKSGEGVADLRAAMHAALDVAEPLRDAAVVSNVRHESLLRQARESLARAIASIEGPDRSPAPSALAPETEKGPGLVSGMMEKGPGLISGMAEPASEELVLADIADARRALEEVTGKRTTEDLLRRVFERFCIGK